jgi:hypothetical protein
MTKTKWEHLLEIMSPEDLHRLRQILYNKGGPQTQLLVDDIDRKIRQWKGA